MQLHEPTISLARGGRAVLEYVRASLAALGLRDAEPVTTAYLDAGIMNYVYRVETPGKTYFLKQALARVKQHDRLGPDLASVSPARVLVEARALLLLAAELAPEYRQAVPAAIWHDDANNILWTQDVAPGAVSLQQLLQNGECDPVGARRLGRLLGAVHAARYREVPPLWPTAAEDRENWLRFLKMRTIGVLPRAELSAAESSAVEALCAAGLQYEQSAMLSHLDAAPKNVLISADGSVSLLDFELGAAVSDPAYDSGFLAGHYLLMGENHPPMREAAGMAAAQLAAGYRQTAPPVDAGWAERLARYAGVTMLYRVYGSSPAPYLSPERYTAIRTRGIELLMTGALG